MHFLKIRRLLQLRTTVRPNVVTSMYDDLSSSVVPNLDSNKYFNITSSNATGIFLMESDDKGYSEMETVAIACVATLIPLCIILLVAFCVRSAWRKFHKTDGNTSPGGSTAGVLRRDESSDPTAAKSAAASTGHLLPEDMKTSESAFSVTPVDETKLEAPQLPLLGSAPGAPTSGPPSSVTSGPAGNHTSSSKSANGSIITLTMQNNHLIVETEAMEEPEGGLTTSDAMSADSLEMSQQQSAQIHNPPPRSPSPPCFTGLSQSLSSISSPTYSYGTQVGYPANILGYEKNLGYSIMPMKQIKISPRKKQKLLMQLSIQDNNYSHHRSSSLPMVRLARTQTLSEAPVAVKEIDETKHEVASRGQYKARASLPNINPVINKISNPPSIAE